MENNSMIIEIDGSEGEGGGQIIRSSLALSLITGKPFAVTKVRAGREKPGLKNQHLTCVKAAAEIGRAVVQGAEVGAREFTFWPGTIRPGAYHFRIGTAGATMMVLQTVLPPLMMAREPSEVVIEGGTHNIKAPSFEFIASTFVPLLNKIGPRVSVRLEQYGFFPRGGGRIQASIVPSEHLRHLRLTERGPTSVSAQALVVKLPRTVAEREIDVLRGKIRQFDADVSKIEITESENAASPGNVCVIRAQSAQLTETFTGLGERGVTAERVAQQVAAEAKRYMAQDVPVGEHLADQLLIPMALAGGGSFLTLEPSLHTTTNIDVIRKFLDVDFDVEKLSTDVYRISVKR
jgi:RNA 3'-terminal phosphate cyclase (ATP)